MYKDSEANLHFDLSFLNLSLNYATVKIITFYSEIKLSRLERPTMSPCILIMTLVVVANSKIIIVTITTCHDVAHHSHKIMPSWWLCSLVLHYSPHACIHFSDHATSKSMLRRWKLWGISEFPVLCAEFYPSHLIKSWSFCTEYIHYKMLIISLVFDQLVINIALYEFQLSIHSNTISDSTSDFCHSKTISLLLIKLKYKCLYTI